MLAALAGLLGLGVLLAATRTVPEHPAAIAVAPALLIAVPAIVYLAWRVEPAWLLSFAIILSPLAGNWPELGIPGAVAPDRLLLVAGIGSVLIRAPALRDRPPLRLSLVHWLMVVAVAYVAISGLVAGTLTEMTWAAKLFDTFGVTPFLVFLVAPVAFRTRRQRDILLGALVVFGAYLGLTALFERIGLDGLVWPTYILDPTYGIHADRSRGPFVEAVTNGFALYTCAVASAIAFKQWRGERRSYFAAVVVVLCAAGIVLTMQRSVWLAAAVATLVTVMTLTRERRRAIKAILALAVALGVALLAIPGLYSDISARFDDQRSIHDRENLNRAAVNMIEERPLRGFGWGEFRTSSAEHFEQADDYPLGNLEGAAIHSTVLTYAVELGLLGAVFWALIVVMGVAGGLPRRGPPDLDDWRVGLLAIAVAYAVITNFVPPQVFPNLALWLWAGIAWVGFQEARGPART